MACACGGRRKPTHKVIYRGEDGREKVVFATEDAARAKRVQAKYPGSRIKVVEPESRRATGTRTNTRRNHT